MRYINLENKNSIGFGLIVCRVSERIVGVYNVNLAAKKLFFVISANKINEILYTIINWIHIFALSTSQKCRDVHKKTRRSDLKINFQHKIVILNFCVVICHLEQTSSKIIFDTRRRKYHGVNSYYCLRYPGYFDHEGDDLNTYLVNVSKSGS